MLAGFKQCLQVPIKLSTIVLQNVVDVVKNEESVLVLEFRDDIVLNNFVLFLHLILQLLYSLHVLQLYYENTIRELKTRVHIVSSFYNETGLANTTHTVYVYNLDIRVLKLDH